MKTSADADGLGALVTAARDGAAGDMGGAVAETLGVGVSTSADVGGDGDLESGGLAASGLEEPQPARPLVTATSTHKDAGIGNAKRR